VTVQETHDTGRKSSQREQVLHRWRWTVHHWRWAVRIAVLIGSAILLYLPVSHIAWPLFVPALSPLVAAAAVLGTHTMSLTVLPALVVMFLAVWQKRWFCHWACPTGCCVEGASWLGRKAGLRPTRLPALGGALAFVILTGACLGSPILLWTDPLALWSNAVGAGLAPTGWTALVGIAAFSGILCVSVLWPQSWCMRICPLGGMQDWMARGKATLVPLTLPSRESLTRSTKESRVRSSQERVPRRVLIGGALGAAWGWSQIHTAAPTGRPLRPPGAARENLFTSLCMRCGNCLRACPTGILSLAGLQHGLAGWLSPVVMYDTNYCLQSCNQCTTVCPSGALTYIPVEQKLRAVMGVPRVDMSVCLLGDDRDCRVCRNRCPFEAIRLEFDEVEYTLVPRIDMHRCPGCGACEVACPTAPRKAITIRPISG
jgi:ferredoxin-type protein NapF